VSSLEQHNAAVTDETSVLVAQFTRIGATTRAGQESRTGLEMVADRPQKKKAHWAA